MLSARGMYDPVVVFDTVVFVRALINPHSYWGRLVFEHSHEYRLIVTPQILREYVEVLQRPELTSRFSTLKGIDVARRFTFQREPPARDWASIGLGISALLPNGLQPFIQFATIQGNENFVSYGGTAGVRLGL